MSKGISLGGINYWYDNHEENLNSWGNLETFEATGNNWVKFWCSMASLLPTPVGDLNAAWAQLAAQTAYWHRLDTQIKTAIDRGHGVILGINQYYPPWANGSQEQPEPIDPHRPAELRLPADATVNSPWGWFVGYLCARYNIGGYGNPYGAWFHALEVTNEPNSQNWPQVSPVRADCITAVMAQTALHYADFFGANGILGPGISDSPDVSSAAYTHWWEFANNWLYNMRNVPPGTPYLGFSAHGYRDAAQVSGYFNRIEWMLYALYHSQGWLGDRRLWVTESGYASSNQWLQAVLMHDQYVYLRDYINVAYGYDAAFVLMNHRINDTIGDAQKTGLWTDFFYSGGLPIARGSQKTLHNTWAALPSP